MSKIKSKIKKGDEVLVIASRGKKRRGIVRQVRLQKNRIQVLVEGVNMVKKHVKPNPNINEVGGIKEIESFIDISNVQLFNPATNKGDRVGYRFLEDGRKVRYFKSSNEIIE